MSLGVKPDSRIKRDSPESEWANLAGHDVSLCWKEDGFHIFNGRLQVETLHNYYLTTHGIVHDYSVVGRSYIVSMNPNDGRLTAIIHETDKCAKCDAFRDYERK